MTATRVIDDHIELENIGTKTHAEIEGHIQGIGNYAFPAADGNADQILKSNGAGVLSWIDKPAGFACGSLNACNLTDIGTRAHASLTGIGTSDHHVKYTDAEVDTIVATHAGVSDAHHSPYTDAEVNAIVATHAGVSDAHHSPYTDAEAVAACDASDMFVEHSVTNNVTNTTRLKRNSFGDPFWIECEAWSMLAAFTVLGGLIKATSQTYQATLGALAFPNLFLQGTDKSVQIGGFLFVKMNGVNESFCDIKVANNSANPVSALKIHYNKIDVQGNLFITSIKSGATQAASGAVAKEVWKTNGHASLPDNVLLIGV